MIVFTILCKVHLGLNIYLFHNYYFWGLKDYNVGFNFSSHFCQNFQTDLYTMQQCLTHLEKIIIGTSKKLHCSIFFPTSASCAYLSFWQIKFLCSSSLFQAIFWVFVQSSHRTFWFVAMFEDWKRLGKTTIPLLEIMLFATSHYVIGMQHLSLQLQIWYCIIFGPYGCVWN
jgi:hypothetical protein